MMLTSLKIALGAAALAAAGVQVPSDAPKAGGQQKNPSLFSMLGQDSRLDRTVTKRFDNATFSQVLDWLSGEGVNFVAKGSDLADARITLNTQNRPLREVMNAIAKAFGGHWTRDGDVYVFQKGAIPFTILSGDRAPAQSDDAAYRYFMSPERMEGLREAWIAAPGAGSWVMDPKQFKGKALSEKEFEELMKSSKDMAKWGADFAQQFKGMKFENGKWQEFKLDEKQIEEMQKRAEEMAKKFHGKAFGFTEGEWKEFKFDEKQMAELHKHGQEMAKRGEEMAKRAEELAKKHQGKAFIFEDGKLKEMQLDDKKIAEMHKRAEELAKAGKDHAFIYQDGKLKSLQDLTPEQRKELEAKMKEMRVKMDQHRLEMEKHLKDVRVTIPKMELEHLKDMKVTLPKMELERLNELRAAEGGMRFYTGSGSGSITLDNIRRLMDSLSEEQKTKQQRQGHLKLSDLTPEQRRMLGDVKDSDDWSIQISINGRKIHLKSK